LEPRSTIPVWHVGQRIEIDIEMSMIEFSNVQPVIGEIGWECKQEGEHGSPVGKIARAAAALLCIYPAGTLGCRLCWAAACP
jgi:hypothetical protein